MPPAQALVYFLGSETVREMGLILRIVKVKRKKVMSGTTEDQAIEHFTKNTIIDL